jgi:hypothetical protein
MLIFFPDDFTNRETKNLRIFFAPKLNLDAEDGKNLAK